MKAITEEQKQTVRELLSQGESYGAIREQTGFSKSTISKIKAEKPKTEHAKPDFGNLPDKKIDVNKMLQDLAERSKAHNKDNKDYRKIAIEVGRPIAIMKAADLHLGGLDVSYESLQRHYDFLLKRKDFYLQLFGDDLNLMIMHPSTAARHDIITPNEQCALLEGIVDSLLSEGKLISMCWGNHTDEFTERNAGFGLVSQLVKHKVPYFRGLGYIDLQFNDQTYPMAFTHKTRFNSFMNALHGNKRLQQLHSEFFTPNRAIAREYITAHTHYPAVGYEGMLPDDRVYYIKCGTFKTNCLYSQRYFGQGRIGVPTMVYHPDRMDHICFPTPWQAYQYMTGKDIL